MPADRPKIVTTSWDDGHPLDQKVAELLAKYGLKGTFYVPAANPEHEVMTPSELSALAKVFELGGHTKNHVVLTRVPIQVASREITECKNWLGDLIGSTPKCFCYPQGKLNDAIVSQVRASGFAYARTVEFSRTDIRDPFLAPTTAQVFNHSKYSYMKNLAKRGNVGGLGLLFSVGGLRARIIDVVEYWLKKIEGEGGIFHLWGHSWEIEQHGLWSDLEAVFKTLSRLDGFRYHANGDLVQYVKK